MGLSLRWTISGLQGGEIKNMEENISNNTNNDNIYGYMRLSKRNLNKVDSEGNVISDEEQLQRQQLELLRAGVPNNHIFNEGIVSGVSQNKMVLNKMLGLREYSNSQPLLPIGSTLIVTELSRLSRDYNELQIILSKIQALNVRLILLDFPLTNNNNQVDDTMSSLINNIVIQVLAYISDAERKKLIERTLSGLEAAKKNGKKLGRKNKASREEISRIYDLYISNDDITRDMCLNMLGVGKTTFHRYMQEERCRRMGFVSAQ